MNLSNDGKYEEAINIFSSIYKSDSIYFYDFKGYEIVEFKNFLSCTERKYKITYLNYAIHIPFQKAIITSIIRYASLIGYNRLIFINNPPIESANYLISSTEYFDNINNDPMYNLMINEGGLENIYDIFIFDNKDPNKNLISLLNDICNIYFQTENNKLLIISNSIFNVDSGEISKYEQAFINGLKIVVSDKILSITQTQDCNYYQKSIWSNDIPNLYLMENKLGDLFSVSNVHTAFLFNKFKYSRESIKSLLNLKKWYLDPQEIHENVKLVKAYRLTSENDMVINPQNLEDMVHITGNSSTFLILKPDCFYKIIFINEMYEIIKETKIKT